MGRLTRLMGLMACLLAPACGSNEGPSAVPDPALAGGIVATFAVEQERFAVWITNRSTIDQVLALQRGTSRAGIPNGLLRRGPGQGRHNASWSWYLDPEDIVMSEVTIEICDGRPSYVEAHLTEFMDTVKRYCPWGARLVDVRDYR